MCNQKSTAAAIYFAFGIAACAVASEPVWPQFRGPNSAGVAEAGQSIPIEFGPERNLVWSRGVVRGHSSPCIWGDKIFLTGFAKKDKLLVTLCLNRKNGKRLWRKDVPVDDVEKVHRVSSPAAGTPCTDGERVYAYCGSLGLVCYDFAGEELWRVPLRIPQTRNGSGTSPVVSGELVILDQDDQQEQYLLAVDRKSGETVWKTEHRRGLFGMGGTYCTATPVVWNDQVLIHRAQGLFAYHIADGSLAWSCDASSTGVSTPVVGDQMVYMAAWNNMGEPELKSELPPFSTLIEKYDADGDGKISREEMSDEVTLTERPGLDKSYGGNITMKMLFGQLDIDRNGKIGSLEWRAVNFMIGRMLSKSEHGLFAIKLGGAGDVTKSHVTWRQKRYVAEVPSPLLYRNRVYMVKDDGILTCFNAATGKLIKRKRLDAGGPYFASPIACDDRILIVSGSGVAFVLSADEKVEVLSRNELGEDVFATPAVVDHTLYVRTVRKLHAFTE